MTVTDHRRWHVCVYAMRMPAGGACSLAHTSHNCVCHRGFWRGLGGRRRTVCCRYVQADCNGPVLTQCRHLLESMMPTQPIAIGTAQSDLRVSYSELSGALTRCPSPPRCCGATVGRCWLAVSACRSSGAAARRPHRSGALRGRHVRCCGRQQPSAGHSTQVATPDRHFRLHFATTTVYTMRTRM